MTKPSIALIEYFTTESETLIFIIRKEYNEPKIEKIKISSEELHKLVNAFRTEIETRTDVEDELEKLSQYLIKPVFEQGYLLDNDYLYIVPHVDLHYLPFHALKHNNCYLGEQFPIAYIPSASVLRFCQAKRKERKKTCLSIGVGREIDPQMIRKSFHMEADLIANLFRTTAFTDLNANKQQIQKESKDKDVIHFACHGFFDEKQPMSSGLLLSDGKKLPVDGKKYSLQITEKGEFLTARDVFSMELQANLVTLSGCRTGVNDIKPGDELIGLTRGFIYAGTPSVLVSLWKVDTYSTSALMERFYLLWKDENLTKIKALHLAQKEVMNITAQQVITAYENEKTTAKRRNDKFTVAFMNTRLGDTYLELNHFKTAETYYLSALQIFNELHKPIDEAYVWHYLEEMYKKTGKTNQANRCIEFSQNILKNVPTLTTSTSRDIEIILDPMTKSSIDPKKVPEKKPLSTKLYQHPFYWAPFVLIGDWK